MRDQEDVAKHP